MLAFDPDDETILAHAGRPPEGPVNRPVQRASTITFRSMAAFKKEMEIQDPRAYNRYGRTGNPNSHDFCAVMAALERGYGAVAAPSGIAACNAALLSFCRAGGHVLVPDAVYSPVRHFCDSVLKRLGVETEYYDPLIGAGIAQLIRDNTQAVHMEAPGSLTFEMQDAPAIAAAAKARGVVTVIDNTWATPLLFKPLALGVNVSVHAVTKYIGGHSDISAGVIVCDTEVNYRPVWDTAYHMGLCAAPDDLYLALRGLRTLGVRLKRHEENARAVIAWLKKRPEVARILCPGLPGDPGHKIWKRDFKGMNGLFGVELRPVPDEAVERFLGGLEYFPLGYSWGGYESLIVPARLAGERTATKPAVKGPLLRLHVGLENPGDLIADLEAGFARMKGP